MAFWAAHPAGAPIALAQDPPQDCRTEAEPNDAPETATPFAGGCVLGRFASGDQDFLALEAAEPALWRFSLTRPGAALDLFRPADPSAGAGPGAKVLSLKGDGSHVAAALTPGRWLLGLSFPGGAGEDWRLSADSTPLPAAGSVLAPGGPAVLAAPEPGAAAALTLTPTPAEARRRWGLEVLSTPGETLQLTLTDAQGRILTDAARLISGPLRIEGMGLEAGSYTLTLRALSAQTPPMVAALTAEGPRLPMREEEPNDRLESARLLASGKPIAGVLTEGDVDLYRFTVEDEARLLTVKLEADPGSAATLSLCLKDAAGVDAQCRSGAAAELGDLALAPGDWVLSVSGGAGGYRLALRPGAPRSARGGHEPNDSAAQARPLTPGLAQSGAFAGREQDRFLLSVEGPPQLWRFAAQGPGFLRIEDGAGLSLADRFGVAGEALAVEDLYLPQGRYQVLLEGEAADYTLLAESMGPLAEGAEIEPNEAPQNATLLEAGRPRVGRLATAGDLDRLRFTLERDGFMALRVDLPEGGEIMAQLEGGGESLIETVPAAGFTLDRFWRAGEYALSLSHLMGSGPTLWRAALDWGDPLGPPGPEAPARLSGALSATRVAAHWPWGQSLTAEIELTAQAAGTYALEGAAALAGAALRFEPASLTLAAGESAAARMILDLPADLRSAIAAPLTLRAKAAAGEARLALSLSVSAEAPPQGARITFAAPAAMLGGFNLASPAFGGRFPAEDGADRKRPTPDNPARLVDGLASPSFYVSPPAPFALRLAFGAAEPVPVAGIALTPAALMTLPYQSRLREFELALSRDGVAFEPVLRGTLGALPQEAVFPLEAPFPARAAELRFLSGSGTEAEGMALAEWAVIAAPGWPEGTAIDLADPARGGHVAWAVPLMAPDEAGLDSLLTPGDAAEAPDARGAAPHIVVGFAASRRALVAAVEWEENALPLPTAPPLWPKVAVWGAETPVGPWRLLGDLPPGPLRRLDFAEPIAARYLRLTPHEAVVGPLQAPAQIRIFEPPVSKASLSAAGWWGIQSPNGPLDAAPEPPPPPAPDADSMESPGLLPWGGRVSGLVERGRDSDHWRFTAPEGETRAALSLSGRPAVLARLALFDEAGAPIALRRLPSGPGEALWEAAVAPGAAYRVEVDEPPRSVVVAVDVSGSLAPFWAPIRAGLSAMAETMTPGRDFVRILPFDQEPAGEWTDDPAVSRRTLAALSGLVTGSGVEPTVLRALRDLAGREGLRSILLLTDGATSGFTDRPAMALALERSGVQIFSAHVGGWDDPRAETRLLQDLARTGGAYAHLQTQAGIDAALARVSAWTRRPAFYELGLKRSLAPPPEPGGLRLTRAPPPSALSAPAPPSQGSAASPPALALILDASGSMLRRMEEGEGRRIDAARAALRRIAAEEIAPGRLVALRVFGDGAAGECGGDLRLPLAAHAPEALIAAAEAAEPVNLAKTPLAANLTAAGADLAASPGARIIVLLTDGEETCGGDPEAAIAALRAQGVAVTVNIVGFAVEDPALEADFARWAAIGGGAYLSAKDEPALAEALAAAMGEGFSARAGPGAEIAARGRVGGPPVPLPAGTWFVALDGGGAVWPAVEIPEGGQVVLTPPASP